MAADPITAALEFGKTAVDKIWPDAGESERAKINTLLTMFSAQADIVKAEAASSNWLTSSWRPLTMLTFTGLIVARWFGWAAPGITEAEYTKLWSIVEFGMGGYVVGRSVEKTAETVAAAISNMKGK